MATYYVELQRPPCGAAKRLDFAVHKEKGFSADVLSPSMTAVFEVRCVSNSTEAVTCVMEAAAGFSPCVRLIMGGRKRESA